MASNSDNGGRACRPDSTAPVQDVFVLPVSSSQQRLWFFDRLEPNSTAYNVPLPLTLTGPLCIVAFEQAFNEIVRRHEILRTTFAAKDGAPVQIIAPRLTLRLRIVDLARVSGTRREVLVKALIKEESERPFKLSQGPLLRIAVLRLSPNRHEVLLTFHHIVFDAWSARVLIQELSSLYGVYSAGKSSSLKELPIQYADVAQWQRDWLQGNGLQDQLNYWKRQLGVPFTAPNLPTDRQRPAIQTYRGKHQSLLLSKELSEGLRTLSFAERTTLFVTLLTAFKVLLSSLSGEQDIVVGTPVTTRNRAEIENLIGLFTNTLPLRTDLSGSPTFREALGRVRLVTVEGLAHQDTPFEKLVEELRPERDRTRHPIFQVLFQLETPPGAWEFSGLRVAPRKFFFNQTKFDLTLLVSESDDGGLTTILEYNADLFEDVTRTRLLEHLRTILEEIVLDPDRRISDLGLMTEAVRHQLLIEWNDTHMDPAFSASVPKLFEARVTLHPDAVAVSFEGELLTYGELNRRANRLAHYLRRLGVDEESLVGVCLERSPSMIVALLGILKAGGAYLPLDPLFPKDRLAFVLRDANVTVLLTQSSLLSQVPESGLRLVVLDSDCNTIADEQGDSSPSSATTPEHLAYTIYTSGSTGKPKGVQIRHRALTNLLCYMQVRPGLAAHDVLVALTTLVFDIAALELFLPLVTGARVVIASRETAADATRLRDLIAKAEATVVQATPATWRMMINSGWAGDGNLRIWCGGEALSRELAQELRNRCESLWNVYGPTETTIWSTIARIGVGPEPISIGSPVANTTLYLLDNYCNPVPIGLPGELYIGGDGLARGYLNRPDLTAAKFVPDPFSPAGTRLYRTGDQARYLSNGQVEFLGRVDHQLKIRGFRVEPAEIEATLLDHSLVREAVVVARDEGGDRRLAAYVVPRHDQTDDLPVQLRNLLKSKLPAYMVPSDFVVLETLPLTHNGKLDRLALPRPNSSRRRLTSGVESARNPTEEVMAGIWSRLLGVDPLNIDDDFFELGGHSLLATQLISEVRTVFQVELSLNDLFDNPTVKALAAKIDGALSSWRALPAPPMEPVNREDPLLLSFAQQRLWFMGQLEPDIPNYNMTTAIHLAGPVNLAALEQSLGEISRRHEILRTSFPISAGRPLQEISQPLPGRLPLAVLLDSHAGSEGQARQLIASASQKPFDLTSGPPWRANLLRLEREEHVGLVVLDHIICDGWSKGILVSEITQLYESFSQGRPSPLPELPIQYADFAAWQRQWLQGERIAGQLAYWKEQLGGEPSIPHFPTSQPQAEIEKTGGASHLLQISRSSTDALKALSKKEHVTLFMTLVAAFQILLHRYSRQVDVVLGTDIAGRTRAEIEGLIGFFANQLVLRTDLSGNPGFRKVLGQVRRVVLGAYANQELPFEKLVSALHPKRDSSRSPLFQCKFVLQNVPMPSLNLSELSLTEWEIVSSTAKFDLLFTMWENEQRLNGSIEYRTDLFTTDAIAVMAEHFKLLLDHVIAQPEIQLDRLVELLNEADRQRQVGQQKEFFEARRKRLKSLRETRSVALSTSL